MFAIKDKIWGKVRQVLSLLEKPYSHLFILSDYGGWSIDEDAKELGRIATEINIPATFSQKSFNVPQVFHYTSQFSLIDPSIYKKNNRISVDYYHGISDQESFRNCFNSLKNNHSKISKVRVSNSIMENFLKTSGIDHQKIMRIPIAVDTQVFKPQTESRKLEARSLLGIPEDAVVIGSFQKDGVGWGQGYEPKLIKGPDIFIKVVEKLKKDIPNLWILLSGPSRGYVKNELDKIGIPYRHQYPKDFRKLSELYDAIDLYIITSREEGGPKACLESMSKGIPLVTTAVGQCVDLIVHGKNAMMTSIDDIDGLYKYSIEILKNNELADNLKIEGFKTAENNNHMSQLPLWKEYFKNLINF